MMEATLYKQNGSTQGTVKLPDHLFDLPWNDELVHQVIVGIEHNMRPTIAHTKMRSQVRGGGRKPWRQKKTGRARHGSIRSPLWVGGGVTFGPSKYKDYSVRLNKKMRAKAFLTVLSQKARSNGIAFLNSLTMEKPSTKDGNALTSKLCKEHIGKKHACLIVLTNSDEIVRKSFRNLQGVSVKTLDIINTRDISIARKIIFVNPDETIAFIERKVTPSINKTSTTSPTTATSTTPTTSTSTTSTSTTDKKSITNTNNKGV